MNLRMPIMALWALLMPVSSAYPCGLCYEDNRAAVYSYEAMEKVKADPDRFEFVVIKVQGALPKKTAGLLTQWLLEREGVDPQTVKISALQKSIGFVLEKTCSKEELISDLSKDFELGFRILP